MEVGELRYSRLFAPTLREVPADVEMTSHRLLLEKLSGGRPTSDSQHVVIP